MMSGRLSKADYENNMASLREKWDREARTALIAKHGQQRVLSQTLEGYPTVCVDMKKISEDLMIRQQNRPKWT